MAITVVMSGAKAARMEATPKMARLGLVGEAAAVAIAEEAGEDGAGHHAEEVSETKAAFSGRL